jgi:hypothetical protein
MAWSCRAAACAVGRRVDLFGWRAQSGDACDVRKLRSQAARAFQNSHVMAATDLFTVEARARPGAWTGTCV